MATGYDVIHQDVEQVCDYVLSDLRRVIEQTDGGNYLAAILITCACDTFSHLKYGGRSRGERFFQELIPPDLHAIAEFLYDAIRNGLVHHYDTRLINVPGQEKLDVTISWGAKPHLHLSADAKSLYINIKTLANDFRNAVVKYKSDLQQDSGLRERFFLSMREYRETQVHDPRQIAECRECLRRLPRSAT